MCDLFIKEPNYRLSRNHEGWARLYQGFRQDVWEGSPKEGGLGVLPQEKKIQSFQFKCSKWPILTEMTEKYGIYFYFLCQQGGISPPVVPSVGPDPLPPPPPDPLAETLYTIYHKDRPNVFYWGVMIAVSNDLISTEATELDTYMWGSVD